MPGTGRKSRRKSGWTKSGGSASKASRSPTPAFPLRPDAADLLRAFVERQVQFMVVGAYALGAHGHPRMTRDFDVWVAANAENATRVMAALKDFGAAAADISERDFDHEGIVFQMGVPPGRVDVI